jgi:DNA-binding LacI/PurR family transcriptional regulator
MARVGIKDVARQAGVSATTVSLVLNGRTDVRIPEATRLRVQQAAREVGYAPNSIARSLRTKEARILGFLSDEIATTPFAVPMVKAAQEVASEHGYLLFLVNTDGDPEVERQSVEAMLQHQVGGLVYACMFHRVVEPPPGLPAGTVFVNGRPRDGGYPAVVPDDRGGAVAAVEELLVAGHRRVAFLDDELTPLASTLRYQGYRDALAAAGVPLDPALRAQAYPSAAGGLEAAGALLDRPPDQRPTALFCFNDRMAMGAYRAVRHRGLRIPQDVSVVGYDDQEYIAADLDPPLTTVALPHYAMGRRAVEALVASVQRGSPAPADVVLQPCPLVRRSSVAAPPDR